MKALVILKNVESQTCKEIIERNLSRILDIRILKIDIGNGVLSLSYDDQAAFDKVKTELIRIGRPIQSYIRINSGKIGPPLFDEIADSVPRQPYPRYAVADEGREPKHLWYSPG